MVQSIGICMILAVTTLTGAYFCLREKYRLQDLRELERAMVMMESQIRFCLCPCRKCWKISVTRPKDR